MLLVYLVVFLLMSSIQKIIKYFAISLAIFLICSILSVIVYALSSLSNVFDNDSSGKNNFDSLSISSDIKVLEIDAITSNIVINRGKSLIVETNNKYIECSDDNGKLHLKEKKHNLLSSEDNNELVIYIPDNIIFDNITIDTAVGNITIEELSTRMLSFDLGAGKTFINNLSVFESTEINGGAGEIIINNSSFKNLNMDMGAGKLVLNSKVLGTSEIDVGVGHTILNFIGNKNDYEIKIDKGIGKALIDGSEVLDDNTYGSGINKIHVNGGIGNTDINFK